jgi:transcriptional regulator with XRE-family HTH domain
VSTTGHQARKALGERLRNLRKDAGLTGKQFAALVGWSPSKVSKIEYANQTPTTEDVRVWCLHTGAKDQVPDLIANLRTIETAYLQWRRMQLPQRQKHSVAVEEKTKLMRWYEPVLVPGLLQTPPYAEAILRTVLNFCEEPQDHLTATLTARLERQQIVYRGNHRFYFIIAEQVLHTRVGTTEVMLEQMDRLLTAMSLPRVVIGVVPATHQYLAPTNNFIMFDDRMVQVETISAELTITQPSEKALYNKAFQHLKNQATHGKDAKAIISTAIEHLLKADAS